MLNDTICAIATATGGALGIVRVSGANTLDCLSHVFTKDMRKAKAYTVNYGHIIDNSCEIVDEVLVTVFRAPHSYTGEESAEISCHASPYILNKVLSLLLANGCRMAGPGEFTMRAYLNGKLDLSQAEAVADIIASTNKASHRLAMAQLRGGVSSELAILRQQLLELTSLLELELDFSDHEDLQFADRSEIVRLAELTDSHITRLADTFRQGNALKNGIPVAIVGAPNVGKSTLLNTLLGEERAIVSDIQGTTRDSIEDTIQIDGIAFRFIDTAGIRHTSDRIEQMGIDRSLAAVRRAHIIILMKEPGVDYPELTVTDEQTIIRIENKTEAFQAKYGKGVEELKQQLVNAAPSIPDNQAIITNARHYESLCKAHSHLSQVIAGINSNLSSDLISEDLREVLADLAEITGTDRMITSQETLNHIFEHHCVGK